MSGGSAYLVRSRHAHARASARQSAAARGARAPGDRSPPRPGVPLVRANGSLDRAMRRALEDGAKQLRLQGQLEGWPRDRVVDEILRQLPEITPLEAHRFAAGWTRQELSRALDALYEADGLMPPGISVSEICRWEHGQCLPNAERQEYLTRLYRTRPDRLGFGRDYSSHEPETADPGPRHGVVAASAPSPHRLDTMGGRQPGRCRAGGGGRGRRRRRPGRAQARRMAGPRRTWPAPSGSIPAPAAPAPPLSRWASASACGALMGSFLHRGPARSHHSRCVITGEGLDGGRVGGPTPSTSP